MDNPVPNTIRAQPQLIQTHIEVASPYAGWRLYFPEEGTLCFSGCFWKSEYSCLIPATPGLLNRADQSLLNRTGLSAQLCE